MSVQHAKLKGHKIYDTIYPVHILSKIFGLTCFSFKSNKHAFISFPDLFVMLFAFWIHFSILILYSTNLHFVENDSIIATRGYPIILSSTELIALYNILSNIYFRKNLAKIIEELDEIDEFVSIYL